MTLFLCYANGVMECRNSITGLLPRPYTLSKKNVRKGSDEIKELFYYPFNAFNASFAPVPTYALSDTNLSSF